jgi:hypothetical protein
VERRLPCRRVLPVLEQEDSLPGAKRHRAPLHGDRQLSLGQGRAQVGRHVVRTLIVMLVLAIFRRDLFEIMFEVPARSRSGIFLDEKRCRRVAAKNSQKAVGDA